MLRASPEQVAVALAASSTWPKNLIAEGVAISLCESGDGQTYADSQAEGDQSLAGGQWGISYGAFQIRTLVGETGRGTTRDLDRLRSGGLLVQAEAAGEVYVSQGLHAWSVTHSPATCYRAALAAGRQAAASDAVARTTAGRPYIDVSGIGIDNGTLGLGVNIGPLDDAGDALSALARPAAAIAAKLADPAWWRRVGLIFGGAVVLLLGAAIVGAGIGVDVPLPPGVGGAAKVAGLL